MTEKDAIKILDKPLVSEMAFMSTCMYPWSFTHTLNVLNVKKIMCTETTSCT